MLIKTIHHKTKDGLNKPLANLTDDEFEEFLDENGFEIVESKGGWSLEVRERTVRAMVDAVNRAMQQQSNEDQ